VRRKRQEGGQSLQEKIRDADTTENKTRDNSIGRQGGLERRIGSSIVFVRPRRARHEPSADLGCLLQVEDVTADWSSFLGGVLVGLAMGSERRVLPRQNPQAMNSPSEGQVARMLCCHKENRMQVLWLLGGRQSATVAFAQRKQDASVGICSEN
jgi:hypothetical protein